MISRLQPMRAESVADTRAGDAGLSGRVVIGSFWMFLGTGTQRLLQFLVLIVLARLISPTAFRHGGGGAARRRLQLDLLAAGRRARDRATADLDPPARPRRFHHVLAAGPRADRVLVDNRTPNRCLLPDGRAYPGPPGRVASLHLQWARDGRRFLSSARTAFSSAGRHRRRVLCGRVRARGGRTGAGRLGDLGAGGRPHGAK